MTRSSPLLLPITKFKRRDATVLVTRATMQHDHWGCRVLDINAGEVLMMVGGGLISEFD